MPYKLGDTMERYDTLHWQSDWNGYEVGYPEIPVVGLYSDKDEGGYDYYIDTEKGNVLEILQTDTQMTIYDL